MKYSELIAKLSLVMGFSEEKAKSLIGLTLDEMTRSLHENKRIEIRWFGSFRMQRRPSRKSRNPKSGHCFIKESASYVRFKPGLGLKKIKNDKI